MLDTIWYIGKYSAPAGAGGAAGRSFLLLKEFSCLCRNVILFTSNSNATIPDIELKRSYVREVRDNVQIIWLRTLQYKVAKSLRRVLSWIHFELKLYFFDYRTLPPPDVVIVSSLSLLTILSGVRLKRKFGCKLVFEVRDLWPLTLVEEGGFSQKNPFIFMFALLERLGYRQSDLVVGTMPLLKKYVSEILSEDKKVICVPMGVTQRVPSDITSQEFTFIENNIPIDKFNVMYAGTIGITNSLEDLFGAAKTLANRADIQFYILGDGPLCEYFKRKYGILSNVTFVPKVRKSIVQEYLSRASVLYLGTHKSKVWEYGQSLNKIIDYMVSGRPIICSYSGHRSMINEADCGYFVDPGDADGLANKIEALTTLPASLLTEQGNKGLAWIYENRSYDKLARYYHESIVGLFEDGVP